MLVQLTDYNSGLDVFLRPREILSMVQLEAGHCQDKNCSCHGDAEIGMRSVVETRNDCFIVREPPRLIMERIHRLEGTRRRTQREARAAEVRAVLAAQDEAETENESR